MNHLQTEEPALTYEEWKEQLIHITATKTNISVDEVKIDDNRAREWYNDGFTPFATFRETYKPL